MRNAFFKKLGNLFSQVRSLENGAVESKGGGRHGGAGLSIKDESSGTF